jgi:predicted amino acid-binding ACT domain protein
VGDKLLKRSADQFLMRTAGSATVCIVGRDAAVRGIATALSQDEANIVRVVQRIAEHPLERRRIELTILHSFGP